MIATCEKHTWSKSWRNAQAKSEHSVNLSFDYWNIIFTRNCHFSTAEVSNLSIFSRQRNTGFIILFMAAGEGNNQSSAWRAEPRVEVGSNGGAIEKSNFYYYNILNLYNFDEKVLQKCFKIILVGRSNYSDYLHYTVFTFFFQIYVFCQIKRIQKLLSTENYEHRFQICLGKVRKDSLYFVAVFIETV